MAPVVTKIRRIWIWIWIRKHLNLIPSEPSPPDRHWACEYNMKDGGLQIRTCITFLGAYLEGSSHGHVSVRNIFPELRTIGSGATKWWWQLQLQLLSHPRLDWHWHSANQSPSSRILHSHQPMISGQLTCGTNPNINRTYDRRHGTRIATSRKC